MFDYDSHYSWCKQNEANEKNHTTPRQQQIVDFLIHQSFTKTLRQRKQCEAVSVVLLEFGINDPIDFGGLAPHRQYFASFADVTRDRALDELLLLLDESNCP